MTDLLRDEPCLVCGRPTIMRGQVHATCAVDGYPALLAEVERLREEQRAVRQILIALHIQLTIDGRGKWVHGIDRIREVLASGREEEQP